ncbi:MAG TPA: hypothetical protein PLM79_12915 [Syntrophobacteraceae bacterium]|nr:hypothetical protein [Syntrophobacteraceae bacterium]
MHTLKLSPELLSREKADSGTGLWKWLVVVGTLAAVFACGAVFYVWLTIERVQNGYRLARLHDEYEQLLSVQRKLRLEWVRLQDPFHMEEVGRIQLGLVPPRPDQKISLR